MEEEEQKMSLFRPLTQTYLQGSRERQITSTTDRRDEQEVCNPQFESQEPQINLESESLLSKSMQKNFPVELTNVPLQDLDCYYEDKKTYVAINRKKVIYRFSSSESCYLFGPFNTIRKYATCISLHPYFQYFMLLAIFLDCMVTGLWNHVLPPIPRIVFAVIYLIEVIIKIISQGYVLEKFTYLRNPWNVMDFLLTLLLFLSFIPNAEKYAGINSLRGVRFMKLNSACSQVSSTIKLVFINLKDVYPIFAFVFFLLIVFGLQANMGVLNQICSKSPNYISSAIEIQNFIHRPENWLKSGDGYHLCGNNSGARHCPQDYTCYEGLGKNPNYGYTNFDNFGWSAFSVFRLMTRDFWEDLADMVMQAKGPLYFFYFLVTIFIGGFCMLNLIFAVVYISFDTIKKQADFKKDQKFDDAVGLLLNSQFYPKSASTEQNDVNEITENTSQLHLLVKRFCSCECGTCFIKFRKILHNIMFDPFMEVFMYLCIIVYTILLALDKTDMDMKFARNLAISYQFLLVVYTIEVTLKIIAMSPFAFFKDRFNCLDFLSIYPPLVAYLFEWLNLDTQASISLGPLKVFVLFRALKLTKLFCVTTYFPNFHRIIYSIKRSWNHIGDFGLALTIFATVFGLIGMGLFTGDLHTGTELYGDMSRWNFQSFVSSFTVVFRAICGEWIETLWDCLLISGWQCIPFYFFIVVIGNFIIVNIFVALLLSNFGPVNKLTSEEVEYLNVFKIALERFQKVFKPKKILAINQDETENIASDINNFELQEDNVRSFQEKPLPDKNVDKVAFCSPQKKDTDVIVNCCPDFSFLNCVNEDKIGGFWNIWKLVRKTCLLLVNNMYFQYAVRLVVLLSLILIIFEDKYITSQSSLDSAIFHLMRIICFLYCVEMFIKLTGLGIMVFVKDMTLMIDFVAVLLFTFGLMLSNPILRAFLSLRICHLLNDFRRYENMKILLNTLKRALPSLLSAFIIKLLFAIFFAILGVQLLAGKFYYCADKSGELIPEIKEEHTCYSKNHNWVNPPVNFDNTINGYFAMLKLGTFKGWILIIHSVLDAFTFPDEDALATYVLVIVIVYQSFFFLKLFIGVLLNSFKEEMESIKNESVTPKSDVQSNYLKAIITIRKLQLPQIIPKPQMKVLLMAYNLVTNIKFEIVMFCIIITNIILMAIDEISGSAAFVLIPLHYIFIVVYISECIIKIAGLRQHYFKDLWNIYEAIIILLLIIGSFATLSAPPFILVIFRAFKVFKIIRFSKYTKGIYNICYSLYSSLSFFIFILIILFVNFYIFSIFGMFLFKNIKHHSRIDEIYNFETFGRSMLTLIQISTTDGWDGVFYGLINTEKCSCVIGGICDCGNYTNGAIFSFLFLHITSFVLINMFLVVVVYHYCQTYINTKFGISQDKYDEFVEKWKFNDLDGTGYISLRFLPTFLESLSDPFQTPEDKKSVIMAMNLTIYKDEKVKYSDVLEALAKMHFDKQENGLTKIPLRDYQLKETEILPTTSQFGTEDIFSTEIQTSWQNNDGKQSFA